MRLIRFLQARPFWLYKLGAALAIFVLGLLLVNGWLAQNDTVFYPLTVFSTTVATYLLGVAFFLLIAGNLASIKRYPQRSQVSRLNLIFLIAVFAALSFLVMIGPAAFTSKHIDSLAYNDHIYNLVQTPALSSLGWSTTRMHILYECDGSGILCRKLYSEFLLVSSLGGSREESSIHQTTIELVATPNRNGISILVDGRMVYLHRLDD